METQILEIEYYVQNLTEKIIEKRNLIIKGIRSKGKELNNRIQKNPTKWDSSCLNITKSAPDLLQFLNCKVEIQNKQVTQQAGDRLHPERLKLCRVLKSKGNYGFNLSESKSPQFQYFDKITDESSAYLAGLRNNDRVFAINGVHAGSLSHQECVGLIKTYKHHVVFLVFKGDSSFNVAKIGALQYSVYGEYGIPRNITLQRGFIIDNFGFSISNKKRNNGCHYIAKVHENGSAARAGLLSGNLICCVNKVDVTTKTQNEVVEMVSNTNDELELTVIDIKTFSLYKKLGITITHELTEELNRNDITRISKKIDKIEHSVC